MSGYASIACGDMEVAWCEAINDEGFTCTREAGHDGPHAAHGENDVPPLWVWDARGTVLFRDCETTP